MTLLRIAALAALTASLSACIMVDVETDDWRDDAPGSAGLLYGAEVNVRVPEVSITVHSNGCTQREHFTTAIKRRDRPESYTVTFRRTVEDHCKALVPEGKRLTWTYQELGLPQGAQVILANRVGR